MRADTAKKIEAVKEAVAGGASVEDALKQVKLSHTTYYKNRGRRKQAKPRKKLGKEAQLLTLPETNTMEDQDEPVTLVMIKCSKKTAIEILKGR